MKLRKDDSVKIVVGKDRGKTGRIVSIDHRSGRAVVQGLNLAKKAVKPKRQNDKGGIVDIEKPLHVSKLMYLCKGCGVTRIGYVVDGGQKARICRKCGEKI